jgi:hypothetical protein
MLFFSPSRGKTYNIPDDKVEGFLAKVPDAVPAEEGMTPAPSAAAPVAPAAAPAPEAPAAPTEEGGGFTGGLNALLTGAGRGLTADFLDEIAGLAAAAGGQIGGRLAGVAPEFLAQEDFYTQGREEEQARQRKLEQESPLLTMAGQVAGALPYAAAAPAAAPAMFGARFAQAAPAALAYGAASGLGQTDIKSPSGPTADIPLDLAENIALGGGAGLLGVAGGAAVGTAASRVREAIARKLAQIGEKADKARVLTAGKPALKEAKKGQGGVDVKEVARVMREVGLGGIKTPSAILARAKAVEEEAGSLVGRIVSEVDAASGGFLKKAEDAKAKAALAAEQNDFILWEKLSKEAEAAEAAAAARRVSGDEISKRLEAQARELMTKQGAKTPEQLDELTAKTYKKLMKAAEQMGGRQLSLTEAQGRLGPLAQTARFEAGAPDIKVTAAAKGARGESRALREQMDIAAEEAFPSMASTPTLEAPLARVGKGERLTEAPTGRAGYQSARRVYDVMQDIIPSAEKEVARFEEMGLLSPARYLEPYAAGAKATAREMAGRMSPKAREMLVPTQERILRSLPYGAESFAEMLRQIDEEAAQ